MYSELNRFLLFQLMMSFSRHQMMLELLETISSYQSLLRSHTSSFLVSNYYDSLITIDVQQFLERLSNEEIMRLPVDIHKNSNKSREIILEGFSFHPSFLSIPWFHRQLSIWGNLEDLKKNLIQMKEKKYHEVKQMAMFLSQNLPSKTSIIDLGSGKGYLSDFLQQSFGFNVIGVETSQLFNASAEKRNLKMARLWKKQKKLEGNCPSPERETTDSFDMSHAVSEHSTENKKHRRDKVKEQILRNAFNNKLLEDAYQIETAHISSGFNLSEISGGTNHAIVGLHTCGDLAADSMRLFLSCPHTRFLCNVGCCYNILSEYATDAGKEPGFPMSDFLKAKALPHMGAIKSIACLSPEKTSTENAKNPLDKLFNRSLLQLLVFQKTGVLLDEQRKVCRNKMGKSFLVFCRSVFPVLQIEVLNGMTDEEIEAFEKSHIHMKHKLLLFNQYRACFAPLLESLFLLDRIQFLQENGIENCQIVQLFDPEISPRCYAIVASKDDAIIF